MQVKMFQGNDYVALEKKINGWLKDNPTIKVRWVTQSQDAGTESNYVPAPGIALVCIWYEY